MSLHFLLDGYNIIKQTSSLNHGTLESQRLGLIKWVKAHQLPGVAKHTTTIVFDGKSEFYGSLSDSDIHVLFSSGESADEVIKNLVERSPKKKWIVVSNDKDIRLYVRALGASILSVKEFISKVEKKSDGGFKKSNQASEKYISLTEQAKITQEFHKIWIKSKS